MTIRIRMLAQRQRVFWRSPIRNLLKIPCDNLYRLYVNSGKNIQMKQKRSLSPSYYLAGQGHPYTSAS